MLWSFENSVTTMSDLPAFFTNLRIIFCIYLAGGILAPVGSLLSILNDRHPPLAWILASPGLLAGPLMLWLAWRTYRKIRSEGQIEN